MSEVSWTDDRVEMLKQLIARRFSAHDIAIELGGITRNAVIGKSHRLGLRTEGMKVRRPGPRIRKKYPAKAIARRRPAIVEEPDLSTAVSLLELKSASCRYAMSMEPAVFCGQGAHWNARRSYPFCLYHCRKCYQDFRA